MSEAPGSTPNFLASLIFTFSSISSLITSWRFGCLWVETKSSLERCSMSKSVIGSPLTITATVCARAGEAIVHIAGADHVLIELVGFKIPAQRAGRDPVRRDLDGA